MTERPIEIDTDVKYPCKGPGCSTDMAQSRWSELHFVEDDLLSALINKETPVCARCAVLNDPVESTKIFQCEKCQKKLPLGEFSAVVCKQHLKGERRQHKRCFECQYPQCSVPGCSQRPEVAIAANHVRGPTIFYEVPTDV